MSTRWLVVLSLSLASVLLCVQANSPEEGSTRVYVGSTPCGVSLRALLEIPLDVEADLVEWKLTLRRSPARYEVHCEYGPAVAGIPGLGQQRQFIRTAGSWTRSNGMRTNRDAIVYDLDGVLSLVQIAPDILHVLNRERSLMVGTGGWSYTLNREEAMEKTHHSEDAPSMNFTHTALASGRAVYGIFQGRTPCQGIAQQLGLDPPAGCFKLKWAITLYRDPETGESTSYKVEGSLYRDAPREGNWSMIRGTKSDPKVIVYRLAATENEAALFLLKGDENVLFFVDRHEEPLVGNANFSYTLNRAEDLPGD